MNYYIDLFSPETADAFAKSKKNISGYRISRKTYIKNRNIGPGDKFICYVTKLMRFIGILEVKSKAFINENPIFLKENDPFVLRFNVKPLVWLPLEKSIPIHKNQIWNTLSVTKNLGKHIKHGFVYKAHLASSPFLWRKDDGMYLERILFRQMKEQRDYPLTKKDQNKLRNAYGVENKATYKLDINPVRILRKPAEIYEWPIHNQNINLPHAFNIPENPYPYSYKMNPAPGSIVMLRSVEDKAFVAIGFVLSSGNISKGEKQKLKKLFRQKWSKSMYLHSFVFKKFRVRLNNVGMKPHRVPHKISKEEFLRVFQRAMLQIKESSYNSSAFG